MKRPLPTRFYSHEIYYYFIIFHSLTWRYLLKLIFVCSLICKIYHYNRGCSMVVYIYPLYYNGHEADSIIKIK